MTRTTTFAVLVSSLSGCSFLYSTDDLVIRDASPDVEVVVDANPLALALDSVEPATLQEGQGTGGGRPVILLIHGSNLVAANTTVTLTATSGPTPAQPPVVGSLVVDKYNQMLAVPVAIPVDKTIGAGQTTIFDVTVSHDEGGILITKTLSGGIQMMGLDELTALPASGLAGSSKVYSMIDIPAGGTLIAAANQTSAVRVHSASSISIKTPISFDAGTAPVAGPDGGRGGMGGSGSPGLGSSGGGPAGGDSHGNPGGFVGDAYLSTLGGVNRSSGGAGGDANLAAVAGGSGGGGGGSLELVAEGDLSVGDVSARGAAGTKAALNGNEGGAGSGGMILLRAGHDLVAGTLDVSGGQPTTGQPGAAGCARADGGSVTVASGPYRGPAFVDPPLIVHEAMPVLRVIGSNDSEIGYFFTQAGLSTSVMTVQLGTGARDFSLGAPLNQGLNHICLLVPGASKDSDTRSCIDVAYLRSP